MTKRTPQVNALFKGDKVTPKMLKGCREYIEKLEAQVLPVSERVNLALVDRMKHARREHPDNGGSYEASLNACIEEAGEVFIARTYETEARVLDESLDAAVTSIRFLNEDYKGCSVKKLEKIRKNSTFMDKVCVLVLVIFCLLLVPVGVGQYVMWYRGDHYSLVFMAMPLGFVFMLVAKFRAILEK